jgi:hypothetical protein
VLGVPASPGIVGWILLATGVLLTTIGFLLVRGRLQGAPVETVAGFLCLALTLSLLPYVSWRFVEDLRVTTGLDDYSAGAAGPIQAYLPGYLVERADEVIPPGATFATVVGAGIPWSAARAAFPSLALETLFPRRSVADPRSADYVLSWGIEPSRVAPVSRVWLVRPRAGAYPPVYVAKVAG